MGRANSELERASYDRKRCPFQVTCVHVCEFECVSVWCMHVRPEVNGDYCSCIRHLPSRLDGLVVESQICMSQILSLTSPLLGFLCSFWGSNSGSHVCNVSTLPIKPPSWVPSYFLKNMFHPQLSSLSLIHQESTHDSNICSTLISSLETVVRDPPEKFLCVHRFKPTESLR